MEKFSDIYHQIKDRFSNPLVFSFICSWLVINWPITLCLFFYDKVEIDHKKYNTIFDFIQAHSRNETLFWQPLAFALVYTVAMPFIKNAISFLYTWTSQWGGKFNSRILKNGVISAEKFIEVSEKYEKLSKQLTKTFNDQNVIQVEKNTLIAQLDKEKNAFLNLEKQLTDRENLEQLKKNQSVIMGAWTRYDEDNREDPPSKVLIESEYKIENDFGKLIYVITYFSYISYPEHIIMILESHNMNGKYTSVVSRLKIDEKKGTMIGTENSVRVKYEKLITSITTL